MHFDSDALERLLSQPDDRLWQMIQRIAAMNGISLSAGKPPKEEMDKLRALLSGADQGDYEKALSILSAYKKGEG